MKKIIHGTPGRAPRCRRVSKDASGYIQRGAAIGNVVVVRSGGKIIRRDLEIEFDPACDYELSTPTSDCQSDILFVRVVADCLTILANFDVRPLPAIIEYHMVDSTVLIQDHVERRMREADKTIILAREQAEAQAWRIFSQLIQPSEKGPGTDWAAKICEVSEIPMSELRADLAKKMHAAIADLLRERTDYSRTEFRDAVEKATSDYNIHFWVRAFLGTAMSRPLGTAA